MGVMSCEETPDVFCMAVTPACSKGALGTWRSQGGPRTLSRDHRGASKQGRARGQTSVGGVYVCQCLSFAANPGKAHEGKPRSEPDRGNPAVRDRRGACGNVVANGSRTEAHRETDGDCHRTLRLHERAALLSRPGTAVRLTPAHAWRPSPAARCCWPRWARR